MNYERAVLFREWKGHKQARYELGSMFSGNFRTTGLQRALDCQWNTDRIILNIGRTFATGWIT